MMRQITTKMIGREGFEALRDALQALCERCAEDNAYFAPDYLAALLETVASDTKVSFLTCWSDTALVGLLPIVRTRLTLAGLSPSGRALQTQYNYSCTPLVDRDHVDDVVAAMIDALAQISRGEWVLPTINVDGAVGKALLRHCAAKGRPARFIELFERATLVRDGRFESHLDQHVTKELRKNLARRRRRLEELGTVTHQIHESGPGLARAVESFLAIEQSGWKGERGTAMAASPATAALARKGFATGRTRADLLLLNNRPIAAVMSIYSGQTGFTVKMAYDDEFAKFSASRLLELEILRSFLESGKARMMDSSTDGPHMIDDFWPGRTKVGTLVFSLASVAADRRLTLYLAMLKAKAALKAKAKVLLRRGEK